MRKTIKAVAIDLDGTLLNSEKEITTRSVAAVHEAMDRGVKVYIATGRSLNISEQYIRQLGVVDPVICYNGSCIWDPKSGEDLFRTQMEEAVCRALLKVEKEVQCDFHAYRRHEILFTREPRNQGILNPIIREQGIIAEGELPYDHLEFMKAIFTGEFAETEKVRAHLTCLFGDSIHQVYSRPRFFEVMSSGSTKGDALSRLLTIQGIDPADVMAIGDESNDAQMLSLVGHSVAMGNATREVKSIARYQTADCDEDGVASIIEKLVLS